MATTKLSFTKRGIEALKPPKVDRQYVYDSGQANLALCMTSTGAKTFYRIGRIEGRPVRLRLGTFPDLSVEQARKMARTATGDIAQGEDPHGQRLAKRHEQTLRGLFDHWLEICKPRKRTWADDQRMFDKYLRVWHSRRLSDIRHADVQSLHARIGRENGPYQANRVLALVRAMFGKATEIGFTGGNPCLGVERFKEQSRERFLLPDEMKPFFAALKAEPPVWRDFWLLALFSGARRGNVAAMEWGDLDLGQGIWYLRGEETKNGLPLAVVLTPQAVAILQTRHADRNGSPYVFPSTEGQTGHIVDPRKSWARVVKAAGVDNLRPHDLRRSLGSWQAIAGASLPIIGASLGHRDPKATAVYSRLTMAPVRLSVDSAVTAMIEAGESKPTKKSKRKPKPR